MSGRDTGREERGQIKEEAMTDCDLFPYPVGLYCECSQCRSGQCEGMLEASCRMLEDSLYRWSEREVK